MSASWCQNGTRQGSEPVSSWRPPPSSGSSTAFTCHSFHLVCWCFFPSSLLQILQLSRIWRVMTESLHLSRPELRVAQHRGMEHFKTLPPWLGQSHPTPQIARYKAWVQKQQEDRIKSGRHPLQILWPNNEKKYRGLLSKEENQLLDREIREFNPNTQHVNKTRNTQGFPSAQAPDNSHREKYDTKSKNLW